MSEVDPSLGLSGKSKDTLVKGNLSEIFLSFTAHVPITGSAWADMGIVKYMVEIPGEREVKLELSQ